MIISIVIRVLNEAKYLGALLKSIEGQETPYIETEVILIDSGSTDETLDIAKDYGCKIIHITREEFSFGRSLNMGCEAAVGEIIVMISGHCVPMDSNWLQVLCQPLIDNKAAYIYGRQVGGPDSHYSECQIFAKYYSEQTQIPQEDSYCNNANSAIRRTDWARYEFDEQLTGLEDMELSKRLVSDGEKIAYVAEAGVYHCHDETWSGIKRRFERESIALQSIMPQIHIRKRDLIRYFIASTWFDWKMAWEEKVLTEKAVDIVLYRFCQYWGSYVGNNDHRKLSHTQKEIYYYPK